MSPAKQLCDYQESVTTGQTHEQTDAGQRGPYVPLCFTSDTTTKQLLSSAIPRAFTYTSKSSRRDGSLHVNNLQYSSLVALDAENHKFS